MESPLALRLFFTRVSSRCVASLIAPPATRDGDSWVSGTCNWLSSVCVGAICEDVLPIAGENVDINQRAAWFIFCVVSSLWTACLVELFLVSSAAIEVVAPRAASSVRRQVKTEDGKWPMRPSCDRQQLHVIIVIYHSARCKPAKPIFSSTRSCYSLSEVKIPPTRDLHILWTPSSLAGASLSFLIQIPSSARSLAPPNNQLQGLRRLLQNNITSRPPTFLSHHASAHHGRLPGTLDSRQR